MDDLCCAVERTNPKAPGLSIIHPNWRRFTDDPMGVETEIRMGQIYDGSRLDLANRFSGGGPASEDWDADMWLRWIFLAWERVAEGQGRFMKIDRIGRVRLLPAPRFRKLLGDAFRDKAFSDVIVVEHHRVYLKDAEAYFIGEIVKQPHTLGKRFGYHDHWPHPMMTIELSEARRIARSLKRLILRSHELPKRGLRRDAWRLSDDCSLIVDDRSITTRSEVSASFRWAQDMVIRHEEGWGGRLDRAIMASRFDLIGCGDKDAIVFDWRMSGDAPPECSFIQTPKSRRAGKLVSA